jgi:PPK2 family polyphosphate:nucleotide phosphotransferase
MIAQKIIDRCLVPAGEKIRLKDYDTGWAQTSELKDAGKGVVKEAAKEMLEKNRARLYATQELLYADGRFAVLVILQGMDAAGKDGTIKHVMAGLNPQGCHVSSFKKPTPTELNHNFLWRYALELPARGDIGIFNRSYYEDVVVVRVHPEILPVHKLPPAKIDKKFWEHRYDDINAFEHHLERNGIMVLKFFLHISEKEQRQRLVDRLENPAKYWKFSAADLAERDYWDEYVECYEAALSATSTQKAPWYVIPADHKWAARTLVADILVSHMEELDLRYPEVTKEQHRLLTQARKKLM